MKLNNLITKTTLVFTLSLFLVPNLAISKPNWKVKIGENSSAKAKTNQFWWPDQLDLSSLRDHDSLFSA